MSKITEKEILQVAKLAKLNLDSKDLDKRLAEFNDILAHIEKLNEIKVEGLVDSTTSRLEMFDDQPRPCNSIEQVLKNSPSSEKPFFYIPRVIEGGKS